MAIMLNSSNMGSINTAVVCFAILLLLFIIVYTPAAQGLLPIEISDTGVPTVNPLFL